MPADQDRTATNADIDFTAMPTPRVIVCGPGCCPGCQDCFGMSIGCHQDPCRCDLPCVCKWAEEDENPRWRDGCERHDATNDRRRACTCWTDDMCGRCGSSLTWERCGACEACGYTVDDPDPGCEVCNGVGVAPLCLSSADWCEEHPMDGCEDVERHTPEEFEVTCGACAVTASRKRPTERTQNGSSGDPR